MKKHVFTLALCALLTGSAYAVELRVSDTQLSTHAVTPFSMLENAISLPIEDADREATLLATIERLPNYADAYHRLGDHYQQTGRYEEAMAFFDNAIKHDPHNTVYAERRAQLYAVMGRYSEGIARFTADLKADPTREHLYTHIVSLFNDLEQYPSASGIATAWTETQPENAAAWLALGRTLRLNEDFDAAESALLSAISLQPTTAALKELQLVYLDTDRFDDGVARFSAFAKSHPTNEQAWLFLSELHRQAGDLTQAEYAAQRRAALLGPDTNVDALNTVASVLEAGGSMEEALKKLFTAERLKKHTEFVHDRIKDIILSIDRVEDGIAYFQRQAKLTQAPHTFRILGELYSAETNWDAAKLWQARFVEAQPYSALGYAQFGRSLAALRDNASALEAFEKAAWFNPAIRDNFYRIRTLYLMAQDYEGGASFFEATIGYFPEKAELHLYMADLLEAGGRKADAVDALTRAGELKPVTLAPALAARKAQLAE